MLLQIARDLQRFHNRLLIRASRGADRVPVDLILAFGLRSYSACTRSYEYVEAVGRVNKACDSGDYLCLPRRHKGCHCPTEADF